LPRIATVLIVLLCCVPSFATARTDIPVQHAVQVETEVHHDTSPPLLLIPPVPRSTEQRLMREHEMPPLRSTPPTKDKVLQTTYSQKLAPTALLNFDGVGNGFTGPNGTFVVNSAPPDTNGSVGPNHYVQIVNTDFAIFNKSGTAIYGPVPINTLWSGFGGGCQNNNDGDPVVVYDKMADRWVISQFSVSTTPYLQCVAVSQTGDPTGAYYRYSFTYTPFPDYPKMGVWPDAYYETFNMFSGGVSFMGGAVCAYDRTKMLQGLTATQQCFGLGANYGGVLPSDLDGARLPPVGSPNYILGLGTSNNDLAMWKFHVDWTTPANTTLTGPTKITVATYSEACSGGTCVPQASTAQQLDSLADRLMFRLAYRNYGDHEALVANHSVTAGSGTGVRWYEIRSPGATPTIFQQGTYAPDSNFRWMGSLAMDQAGNTALGFSVSSTSLHPQVHYTGRLASDAPGTMGQGEATLINGVGSQAGLSRWGDYSAMAIDPSDDCTFWYTNEYIPSNGSFNWSTRIGSFKLPNCGATATATTTTLASSLNPSTYGQGVTLTATVAPSSGTGTPTGTVAITDGATALGSPTLVNGSASLTVSSLSVATHALSAVYSGDSNYQSSNGALSQIVNKASTLASATSNLNPAGLNQLVTYTANVTSPSANTLTGTLTLKDGTTTLATFSTWPSTFQISYPAAGTHSITATYSGDGNNLGSTSLVYKQYVEHLPVTSTTKVTTSGTPSVVNTVVTFSATVSSTFGAIPNGETVTFFDGTSQIGVGTTSAGVAFISTGSLKKGTHTITAKYAGDATFKASSGTVKQVVSAYTTSTTLSANPASPAYGQAVTLSAVVASAGATPPTGQVTFSSNGVVLGKATLAGTGTATLATTKLATGSDSLTAAYGGDAQNAKSTSPLTVTVNPAQITIALTSSPNPSTHGKAVKFTATLTSNGGLPVGQTVTFSFNGSTLGTVKVASTGIAALTTATLPAGSDVVTVTYAGDANHNAASTSTTQTVN
jgi:hypothetical protein